VRHVGCSNFAGAELQAAIECANQHQLCSIATHQIRFNLLDRRAETDVIPIAHAHGVANLAYSPLAEGLLTGKYSAGEVFPADSRFAVAAPANNYDARLTAPVAQAIESLRSAAAACSMPLWRFALTWVLSNPAISCVLLGPSNREQIKALTDLMDFEIDGELVNSINPPGTCVWPGI
jgi:aryl-alcohol dehydrogenase-like predicted oxidoreductase